MIKITGPVPSGVSPPVAETLSRPATSGTTTQSIDGLKTSLADADDMQRKIKNLMVQAAIHEKDTKTAADIYEAYSVKMSPFQWGKKAFVKATHAIKDRVNNHSIGTSPQMMANSQSHIGLNDESEASSLYETDEDDTRSRLTRRIAEGQNLANPKIQAMVGDGKIPRKPLPVYESMKSRSLRSGTPEDPFSDGYEAKATPSPQIDGQFDIDFNKRAHEKVPFEDHHWPDKETNAILPGPRQHLSVPHATTKFSNLISGLAQHPDVTDFSSSPVGFSTPRIRLEPQPVAGAKRKTGLLSRSPSILEFSFESKSDDETSLAASTTSKSVTDGSQSIKRKSAHSDLRSPTITSHKKSKLASLSTSADASLVAGISQMATNEERIPLSPRDRNATFRLLGHPASKGRGLNIFELGKGKIPKITSTEENKKPRPRPILERRPSLPRPKSMLFRGRDPRPGLKRLTSIDADGMDIDELQIDDANYQVGRKQR